MRAFEYFVIAYPNDGGPPLFTGYFGDQRANAERLYEHALTGCKNLYAAVYLCGRVQGGVVLPSG